MRRVLFRLPHLCTLLMLLTLTATSAWAQSATLVGQVTDASDGSTLPSANVIVSVQGTLDSGTGAATNLDGRYRIERLRAGTYIVQVRYIGYQDFTQTITLAAGETRTLDVALSPGGFDLNDVVVSASRAQEQVLDAPASVTVLGAQEIQQNVTPSSIGAIRNEASVDVAQTGVDRQEVVLRGFNNAFSGATFTLVDYRQAAVPSLNVNIYSFMPNMSVDLDRIEIVRGPGSALYGAGVDAGVVHFFTKDPFTNPGTAFALTGGQQSLFGFEGRHAGVISDKIGYKITGQYARADDFTLDPGDPMDQAQLEDDFVYANPSAAPDYQDVDPTTGKLLRDNDYQKSNVNGLLQYRVRPGVTVSLNGGYSALRSTVLSGIGTLQARDFGYTYGQLRLQAGSFFSQFYVNKNNAGDSYVYGTGQSVVDNGVLYVGQAQYDWDLSGKQRIIAGADARLIRPDTEGTILGRNEDDDNISQVGVYAQSTTNLTEKLDLTLALRGDYNDVVEDFQLSPRAAVVFKAAPGHTVRATFNSAFSAPGTNSLFLDIVAGRIPNGPVLRARGSAQGYTFERNEAYGAFAGTDLVASSLNPATLGAKQPVGLPLANVYGSVYAGLAAIPLPQLTAILQQQGLQVNQQTVGQLVALLSPQGGTSVQGFSQGRLAILNPSAEPGTNPFIPVTDVADVAPLKQTTTQTVELGYKGLVQNKLLVAVDLYYSQKKNFIGPLLVETPFVFVPTLSADLTAALGAGIAGNAQLAGALGQLGLTPAQVAGIVTTLAAGQLPSATTPVAIVQPQQNDAGAGAAPELLLTYRNFGRVEFFGADVSLQFLATDRLSLFGNVSVVSDDFFDNEELDEANTNLSVALNAPAVKSKAGFSYAVPRGLSFNASGRYVSAFPVQSGPYVGEVESYFLMDLGAGYDLARFAPGLRIDATVQNVLDNERREFIGAPKIGRLALVRLGYSF